MNDNKAIDKLEKLLLKIIDESHEYGQENPSFMCLMLDALEIVQELKFTNTNPKSVTQTTEK